MQDSYSVILTTAGSPDEARALGRGLVEAGLVACVQLLPIDSIYSWEGKVEEDSEFLMLLKARSDRYEAIESYLLEHHSYDTPELLQLDVERGSGAYLAWIDSVTVGGAD
jgi:periplasmic divalent cation tolerance protein